MGRAVVHMTPHGMFSKAEGIALLRQLTPLTEGRIGGERLVTFSLPPLTTYSCPKSISQHASDGWKI